MSPTTTQHRRDPPSRRISSIRETPGTVKFEISKKEAAYNLI